MFTTSVNIQRHQVQFLIKKIVSNVIIESRVPALCCLHNLSSHSFIHKAGVSLKIFETEEGLIQRQPCPVYEIAIPCKNLLRDHAVTKSIKDVFVVVVDNGLRDLKAAVENSLFILGSIVGS